MWPFELVATATDSPSDSPAGSFRKFGTGVNGISATPVMVAFCCAAAETAVRSSAANVQARYLGICTSRTPQCSPDYSQPRRRRARCEDLTSAHCLAHARGLHHANPAIA